MNATAHFRTVKELVDDGSILAIQDGNHGGSHPKASEYVPEGIPFVMASDIRAGRLDLDNCKRLIPEGWSWSSVGKVLDFDPKTRVGVEGEKPFISMGHLDTSTSVIAPHEWRHGNSGAKFQTGDVLFARITPCLENGKTGLVRDLPGGVGFGSTEFIVIRRAQAGSAFAYCLARSAPFRAHAVSGMSGASGRQRARTEVVSAFSIATPPGSGLFDKFEAVTAPMLDAAGAYAKANVALTASRDLLLPRLISGQLSVAIAERELREAA